jgi:hypothetical protein
MLKDKGFMLDFIVDAVFCFLNLNDLEPDSVRFKG